MGRDKTALKAVLWAALLLCGGACQQVAGLDASSGAAGRSGSEVGASVTPCPRETARCGDRCNVPADCDEGKGGHACLPSSSETKIEPVKDVTSSTDLGRPSNTATAGDAGDDDADAGPDGHHRMLVQERGYCARACETELCTDPRAVCSSSDGFCRTGCDRSRPACDPGQACDFDGKHCLDLDGHCDSADACGVFDSRLKKLGTVSCEDHRCRYRLNLPDIVQPLRSPIPIDPSHTLNIQAPVAGERIKPADLPRLTFQFDVPAQVIVATVLTRPIKNLEDGTAAAVWIAYLDQRQAARGVVLGDGGEMRDGMWQRYADVATATLPLDTQLYFFVVGYDQGQLVAQSELVPFKVAEPVVQPGSKCDAENGMFCAGSGLICADDFCRTPCLSDDDCAGEGRSCSDPGMSDIDARLCL